MRPRSIVVPIAGIGMAPHCAASFIAVRVATMGYATGREQAA